MESEKTSLKINKLPIFKFSLLQVVNGGEEWLSIGHAHPQFPQVFNMISEQKKTEEGREALVLRTGDTLAARLNGI